MGDDACQCWVSPQRGGVLHAVGVIANVVNLAIDGNGEEKVKFDLKNVKRMSFGERCG